MLPHDVLCAVAAFSHRNELFSLMLTSRDLQLECAKQVLRDPVLLNSNNGIMSFIYFMHRDQRRRWRFLRSLEFGEARIDPRAAEALGRVISRASHLESLHFENAEATLGAHPQLGLGLAAIPTVKHIVIACIAQHACRMLEAMSWPLETAVLEKSVLDLDWHRAEEDSLTRMHPAALLKNARATLQSLEYDMWSEFLLQRLPEYPVYPVLHTLRFAGSWLPPTSQWPLTYPNLKNLMVSSIDGDEEEMVLCTESRLENLQDHAEVGCWPELEHFSGGALDLYSLGLPCRIHNVDISVSFRSLSSLEPALADAQPNQLTISVWQHELYDGRTPELELPSHLRMPGMAKVQTMRLKINAGAPVPTVDFDAFLEHTFDALAPLDLRELVLFVAYPDCKDDTYKCVDPDTSDSEGEAAVRPPSPFSFPPPCPLQIWAETVDARALASRAFDAIHSIQSFEVIIHPPDSIIYRYPFGSIEQEDRATRIHRDEITAPVL
ncbi:hypothetical protein L226DRAFT_611801 [Lentinus tigrinus ALCF2SS1-7]|uniref:F-box domain-containing protein n=1 Tax=Lentinus tigrinus ALCF2SS1-6 TaxID=1328759 RepID=A0A5C2SM32_9APHY|nr:hypothetical protein L227DRAFT_650416 [Lentinus tigrinus ALCF2SS1-6]RPD76417.1 hypothetical protein L226DRAFT_611801 [Lentinus tigrinus ALCF2SS1-7]